MMKKKLKAIQDEEEDDELTHSEMIDSSSEVPTPGKLAVPRRRRHAREVKHSSGGNSSRDDTSRHS
jgi:hypothetical protein